MNDTSLSLLQRVSNSNENEAWNRLNELYAPLIRTWLLKYDLQASDVDDLTQEVMLTVSGAIESFDHNGHDGAFRAWLKSILVNRLRNFWRTRDRRPNAPGGSDMDQRLAELDDPASQVSLIWNQEHDQHVLKQLLAIVEPQFEAKSWAAFRKTTLEGQKPDAVAADLGISLNAVFIAKSRVISRLRQEADGLIEASSRFLSSS